MARASAASTSPEGAAAAARLGAWRRELRAGARARATGRARLQRRAPLAGDPVVIRRDRPGAAARHLREALEGVGAAEPLLGHEPLDLIEDLVADSTTHGAEVGTSSSMSPSGVFTTYMEVIIG